MEKIKDISGKRFGKWVVLDDFILIENNKGRKERKWLCVCDCGTQRYVLERSLLSGGSKSCGCQTRENAVRSVSYDLKGKIFGDLEVLAVAENHGKDSRGGIWWTCRCSCGNLYDVPATLLVNGRRTDCGRKNHEKNYVVSNIEGRKFNRLTALYPTKERDKKGSVIWHCRCDCGNEIDVSYNTLVYSNIQSCGCRKKEHDEKLSTFLTHIAGTSLDIVKSKKVPTDNTSGYKGVYLIKGKYVAKIVFQKKQYYLGVFDRIEDAAKARKDAEEILFDGFAAYYEKYQERAASDPVWAANNPIAVFVDKQQDNHISVAFRPILD